MSISYPHFLDEFPPHTVPKNAWETVRDTYALRDENGAPCETFDELLERVASAVCTRDVSVALRASILDLMRRGVFYPNVVFMMNAGTPVRNFGACYLLKPEDSMDGIRDMLDQIVQIQTAGGGCGIDLSNLRAKGSLIHSSKGTACGPVAVMKLINAVTETIGAGGRRRGANICVLDWKHPDIIEFIVSKSTIGELTNVNISVLVDDTFFGHVGDGHEHIANIFYSICTQAHKTGDPGLLYYEALNRDNPIPSAGDITITNPCGEVALPAPAACNLGSIDVSKFVKDDGAFDYTNFERVVAVSGSFLREALESGCYVGEEIQERMSEVKPIGLGIMGFADALIKMKIRYGSDVSLEFAGNITKEMKRILKESFPECGLTMAFAPTGTLARLANCSSGIEPNYAFKFVRTIEATGQKIEVIHPLYAEVHGPTPPVTGIGSQAMVTMPDYFVDAYGVTPEEHVEVLAAFQRHVNGGVCLTGDTSISLVNGTEVPIKDLVDRDPFYVYSYDHETGKIVPGLATATRTRLNAELVEVELDNGEKVRCTPDHRWMLRNGEYKEAKDLRSGNSLMPLYRKLGQFGYEQFKAPSTNAWRYTHKYFVKGESLELIHHKDFNKRNNCPDNLEWMLWEVHRKLHSWESKSLEERQRISNKKKRTFASMSPERKRAWREKLVANNPMKDPKVRTRQLAAVRSSSYREGCRERSSRPETVQARIDGFLRYVTKHGHPRGMLGKHHSVESNKKCSESLKSHYAEYPETRELISKVHKGHAPYGNQPAIMKALWKDPTWRKRVLEDRRIARAAKKRIRLQRADQLMVDAINHKVISVKKLDYREDCYDLTVDKYHNFALSAGVFVHNSKTVNLSNDVHLNTVKDVFLLAHELGCKGITVFRDGCREGVLSVIDSVPVVDEVKIPPIDKARRKLPLTCNSIRHKFRIGECEGYIHTGTFEDGSLGEIFLIVSKAGSTLRGMYDSFATSISLGLQYGIPLEALIEKFRHVQFEPAGITGSEDIRFASSIVDYVFTWLEQTFCDVSTKASHVGNICPKCSSVTAHRSGCEDCLNCGWSKCS